MGNQDPAESIVRLKKQIDRVLIETVRAGNDLAPVVADIKAILARASK